MRTLFDQSGETRPSEGGADTRFQAAARIQPLLSHLQKRVLSFIVARGEQGCTDEEIADGLKMNKDTTRPRRYELEKERLVFDSGMRRATASGCPATVWTSYPSQESATLRAVDDAGAFAGWVLRSDVDGRMGWEAPNLPASLRWWARYGFDELPTIDSPGAKSAPGGCRLNSDVL